MTPTSTNTERKPIQKDVPIHVTMKDLHQSVLRGPTVPEEEHRGNHKLS